MSVPHDRYGSLVDILYLREVVVGLFWGGVGLRQADATAAHTGLRQSPAFGVGGPVAQGSSCENALRPAGDVVATETESHGAHHRTQLGLSALFASSHTPVTNHPGNEASYRLMWKAEGLAA